MNRFIINLRSFDHQDAYKSTRGPNSARISEVQFRAPRSLLGNIGESLDLGPWGEEGYEDSMVPETLEDASETGTGQRRSRMTSSQNDISLPPAMNS